MAVDVVLKVASEVPGGAVTVQYGGQSLIAEQTHAAPTLALAEKLVNLPPDTRASGRATRTGLHRPRASSSSNALGTGMRC
ncbi:hypothetical protein [uncultured Salipiger sp.]|uniref:hypothetical protein n=1 Tax=uncultured Salipiger sp. TaxID=499810 RepID=UPI0025941FA3|nr:hypothetical protein [uncultured Salipiger sp.]